MNLKIKKGFTLIELIVVVAIISLLSSIIISSLSVAKQKSSDTAKIKALQEFRTALNMYFNDSLGGNETYPGAKELKNKLTTGKKYIASIDSNIIYLGQEINFTRECTEKCPAYIAAIKLERTDNKSQGKSADCTSVLAGMTKCYYISSK